MKLSLLTESKSIYFSLTIVIIIITRALPDSKLFFQECPRPFLQLIDITQLAFALSFIRFANMWQNWFVLRPSLWFTTGYWAVWSDIHLIQPSRIVQCSWIRELLKRRFCSSWFCFYISFLSDQPMKQLDLIKTESFFRKFHFCSMKALSNVQHRWSSNWLHQYCFSRSKMRVFGRISIQTIAS